MKQSIRTRWFTSGLSLFVALGALAQGTAGLQVNNHNGKTVVIYDGQEVWSGTAAGTPTGRSSNINGVKHAAVFDGDRVLWENTKGAAAALGSAGANPAIDQQKFLEQHQKAVAEQRRLIEEHQRARPALPGGTGGATPSASGSSSGSSSGSAEGANVTMSAAGATVRRTNGDTSITWRGTTVKLGQTTGRLSLQGSQQDGAERLTLTEGNRVIWESTPSTAPRTR